jgi:outer membrane protein assembly factor BamB
VTSSTVDIVFMTGTHYLNALDAATGALRWRVETDDWTSTPAIAYDRVFLAESDGFRVFDTAGNFIRHGTLQTNTHASPFVSDGVLYLTGTGELAAFDAVGDQGCPAPAGPCTPIWTSPPSLSSLSSPIENVGTVYAGGDDDALHAFTPS